MHKVVVLSTALALLGVGTAGAQELFQPSDPNAAPVPPVNYQIEPRVDPTHTAGIETAGKRAGFSAAWAFGPSDQNDLPAPRFQQVQ